MAIRKDSTANIRFIPLTYNHAESQTSALRLILALFPHWEHADGQIELIRFTDGITNTLLKAVNKIPGLSEEEIDNDAVLLRAYGKGTDLLIDRERETQNHELLGKYKLAPKLLARFSNGMLYRFIRGRVTSPEDLRQEPIWRGVARRLAQWHAVVPCLPNEPSSVQEVPGSAEYGLQSQASAQKNPALQKAIDNIAPGKPAPNVWTTMQKWIYALPTETIPQSLRQEVLQHELTKIVAEFSEREGLGENSVGFPKHYLDETDCDSLYLLIVIYLAETLSFNQEMQQDPPSKSRLLTSSITSTRLRPQQPLIWPIILQNGEDSTATLAYCQPGNKGKDLSKNTSRAMLHMLDRKT